MSEQKQNSQSQTWAVQNSSNDEDDLDIQLNIDFSDNQEKDQTEEIKLPEEDVNIEDISIDDSALDFGDVTENTETGSNSDSEVGEISLDLEEDAEIENEESNQNLSEKQSELQIEGNDSERINVESDLDDSNEATKELSSLEIDLDETKNEENQQVFQVDKTEQQSELQIDLDDSVEEVAEKQEVKDISAEEKIEISSESNELSIDIDELEQTENSEQSVSEELTDENAETDQIESLSIDLDETDDSTETQNEEIVSDNSQTEIILQADTQEEKISIDLDDNVSESETQQETVEEEQEVLNQTQWLEIDLDEAENEENQHDTETVSEENLEKEQLEQKTVEAESMWEDSGLLIDLDDSEDVQESKVEDLQEDIKEDIQEETSWAGGIDLSDLEKNEKEQIDTAETKQDKNKWLALDELESASEEQIEIENKETESKWLSLDELDETSSGTENSAEQIGMSLDALESAVEEWIPNFREESTENSEIEEVVKNNEVSAEKQQVENTSTPKKNFAGILIGILVVLVWFLAGWVYVYFNNPTLVNELLGKQSSDLTAAFVSTGETTEDNFVMNNETWENTQSWSQIDIEKDTSDSKVTTQENVDSEDDVMDNNIKDTRTENIVNSESSASSTGDVDIVKVQTSTTGENVQELIKDVKKLIIKNYLKAKQQWDDKAVKLLKNILTKVNKINPDTANEKTIATLEKFKKILTKRLQQ